MDLISIIIPIYNVADYLDECMESVLAQTYTNLEIIVINDGSIDGSGAKCLEWQRRDERILFVSKRNQGLGPTRNMGILLARGSYISFIDSDDWIEPNFIEELYGLARKTGADIVQSDIVYRGEQITVYEQGKFEEEMDMDKRQRMTFGFHGIQLGLYRRRLWTDNQISMPSIPFEDLATFGILAAYANAIRNTGKPLYHYRVNRPGGIINSNKVSIWGILNALEHLLTEFKKRGFWEEYREALLRMAVREIKVSLEQSLRAADDSAEKGRMEEASNRLLDNFFEKGRWYKDITIGSFGSYNSARISNELLFLKNPVKYKYQFSSIISAMGQTVEKCERISHDNPYRESMLKKDIEKHWLKNGISPEPDLLLLDFLEERFDIGRTGESYITISDAYEEAEGRPTGIRLIGREGRECETLWKKSCLQFIDCIKARYANTRVFLIRLFLNECYGNLKDRKQFQDCEEIGRTNSILKKYYDFFIDHYEDVVVIEPEEAYCFTDEAFIFGCFPWHFNRYAYYDITRKIRRILIS